MSCRSLLSGCAASWVLTAAMAATISRAEAPEIDRADRETEKISSLPSKPPSDLKGKPASDSAQPFDVRFFHRECFAALVIHPGEILKSPSLRLLPIEMMEQLAFGNLGFEFSQAREIVLLYGIDDSYEFFGAAIYRFEKPYAREKLLASIGPPDSAPRDGAPKTYRIRGGDGQAVALPDDHTVLLAPPDKLPVMLASTAGASPLVERLGKTNLDRAATFVAVTWPAKAAAPFIDELFSSPEERDLARILTLFSAAEVRFDLGEGAEMTVILDCHDAKDVAELNRLLDQAVVWGAQFFDVEPTEPADSGELPLADTAMRYFKRLLQQLASDFDCQEKEDRLVLRIKSELLASAGFGAMATEYLLAFGELSSAGSASEAVGWEHSQNNLQRIGEAALAYHQLHEKLPQSSVGANGKRLLSWRVELLPFLGEWELYQQFRLDEPWDSEHNLRLAERMPAVFRSDENDRSSKTCYLAAVGPAAVMSPGKEASLGELGEKSRAILFVETNASRATLWTKPDDFVFNPADPLAGLGGRYAGGFLALYADGQPQFVFFNTEPAEIQALFQPKAAESADKPAE